MTGIFLCRAPDNDPQAEEITRIFRKKGIHVYFSRQGQESRGDGHWPREIEETIGKQDSLLLLWSQHAQSSELVTYQLSVAGTMGKTIYVVPLDHSPLPNVPGNGDLIPLDVDHNHFEKIPDLMQISIPLPNPDTMTTNQTQKWWEKWQIKIAFALLVLTFFGVFFDLPEKATKFYRVIFGEPAATCMLKGEVWDSKGQPVQGAEISLDVLPGKAVKTTTSGSFKFKSVPGKVGDSARVSVYFRERMVWNEYVTLPGPVRIKLETP